MNVSWRHLIRRTTAALVRQGWISNLLTGGIPILVSLLIVPMLNTRKSQIIAGAAGLTVLVWVLAAVMISEIEISDGSPFLLSIETAWQGATRDSTQIVATYRGGRGDTITPVPIALFLRIVNRQSIPARIDTLRIQVAHAKRRWLSGFQWMDTKELPDILPLYWVNSFPDECRPMQLIGPRLTRVLEKGPIPPNETVEGWLLLDVPESYDSALTPRTYRLTVKDTQNNSSTQITQGPVGGEGNVQQNMRGFNVQGDKHVSLRSFTVKHFADPVD